MDNQSQDEKSGRKTKESLIFCSTKALEGLGGNYAIRTQDAQTSKSTWFYKEIVYLNIAKQEPITSVLINWNTFNPFPVRLIGSLRPVGN